MVLRKMCGPKMEEVRGGWRKLPTVELYDFYSSPNIILVITSRTTGGVRPVAHMWRKKNVYRVWE
jgi:hypothetical protein